MKKYVIYNLTNRSVYQSKGIPKVRFSFNVADAAQFDKRENAESLIPEILPHMTRQTKENSFWCDGFALIVLEVYV